MSKPIAPLAGVRPEKLQLLHAASLRLLGLLTVKQAEGALLKEAIESLAGLIGARYAAIGLLDDAGKLKRFVHTGLTPEEVARIGRLPEGKGLLGVVIHENHALRLDDMTRDPRAAGLPPNHPPMKSLLAVPVSHGGAVYGRVYLSEKTDGTPFTDEDEQLVAHFAEALALTLHFHRAEAERLAMQDVLQNVAHAVSAVTGQEFFQTLVLDLAKALNVDYAFVGEVVGERQDAVRTIAVNANGRLADNFTYALEGTPCLNVVGKTPCQYPRDVQQRFPEDRLLREMGIESYVGYPLQGSGNQTLGLLVVMDGNPMHDPLSFQAVLQICAVRAAAELERRQTEGERLRLASAVEQTADSVLITDAEGIIQYVNPAFEKVTGYTAAEALGQKPKLIKSGRHGAVFYKLLWDTITAGKPFKEIFINRRKNGELYYDEKTITPIKDAGGRITHFISTGKDISERVHNEQTLRASERRYAELIEQAPDAIVTLDLQGHLLTLNPAAEQMCGFRADELTGKHFAKAGVVAPESLARATEEFPLVVIGEERPPFELVVLRKDGGGVFTEINPRLIHHSGQPSVVQVTLRDITERKLAETALGESEERFRVLVETTSDWIWEVDAHGVYTYASPKVRDLLGYEPEEIVGKTPFDLMPPDEARRIKQLFAEIAATRKPIVRLENVNLHKDGHRVVLETNGVPISDRNGEFTGYRGIDRDITERKHAEEQLNYLAYYDTLTGLPNRALLLERLHQATFDADRVHRLVAVMFLDLDRFKYINDTLGHHVGDGLLKGVAERLQSCVRSGDTIARLGGDEFTVVLASVAHVDDIARVARKILESFAEPFHVEGHELFTTSSIGVTLYPFDEQDPEGLLKNADAAMYHAKERGRNTFQYFTNELNVRAERRLRIETALRQALERNELSLHYQPQVDLKSGRLTGMEALARWHHPELGNVSPAEFIPVAEETGLIMPIGEWVLREACRQIKAWHDTGFRKLQVAVNLSGKQLRQKDFPDRVKEILRETKLESRYLDLELTESLLMVDTEETADIMHALHAMGVSFSVDDFGTGYSSLSYLKRFPIDVLKIDRSFVRDIASDPNDVAIVKTIIAMAHTLGMRVIAEGVETRDQLEFLRGQGCDGSQGYYCSMPLSAEEFSELLADWKHIRADRCEFARKALRASRPRQPAKAKRRGRARRKPAATSL